MTRSEIARHLLEAEAVKLSPEQPFTWASGWQSPIYCDNRILLSYPEVRTEIVKAFAVASEQYQPFDVVAGVATAGIPHAALLAEGLGKPMVYVRDKAKGHGRQNRIEGRLPESARVLVIEDLISTGGSSLRAVEALQEAGAEVVGTLAIFTYEFDKAKEAFETAGVPLSTLTDYSNLLEEAVRTEYIAADMLPTLQAWRAAPGDWGK